MQVSSAVHANKGLLGYKQIHPMDPVIARVMLEFALFTACYLLIFSLMNWLGFYAIPDDLLLLAAAHIALGIFSIGIGLMICAIQCFYDDVKKLVNIIARPLYFCSGIFFVATSVPQQYWYLLDWNPIFHALGE